VIFARSGASAFDHASALAIAAPAPSPPPTPTPAPATAPAPAPSTTPSPTPAPIQSQKKKEDRPMLKLSLVFTEPGFIAHPYFPEVYKLIQIEKESGVNRARSDANKRRALEAYLTEKGMTLDHYEDIKSRAARPFATSDSGEIIIESDKILSALVNADDVAPRNMRIDSIRTTLRASDFLTGKNAPDGVWERFAVVRSGTNKLSNQRGFRSSAYISNFTADGTIEYDAEMVNPKTVVALLQFCGRKVGIGASRKMGWGRFTVEER
jgi:hypothetical protein